MKNLTNKEQLVYNRAQELAKLLEERGVPCTEFKIKKETIHNNKPRATFDGESDGFQLKMEIYSNYVYYEEEEIMGFKLSTITMQELANNVERFYYPLSDGGRKYDRDNTKVIRFTRQVIKELKRSWKLNTGDYKWKYVNFNKKLMSVFVSELPQVKQIIYIMSDVIKEVHKEEGEERKVYYYTTNPALEMAFPMVTPNDVAYFIYEFQHQLDELF